jgi:hypothetical protein
MSGFLTPPRVGRRAIKVWQRDRDAWFKFYKASLVGNLGEPVLFLLAFGLGLSKFIGNVEGVPYIRYIAPGLLVATAMNASSFECTFGSFTRMSTQKSYDAIIVTPVNIEEVAAGDILWGATKGFISAIVMLPVGARLAVASGVPRPVRAHRADVRVDGAHRHRVRAVLRLLRVLFQPSDIAHVLLLGDILPALRDAGLGVQARVVLPANARCEREQGARARDAGSVERIRRDMDDCVHCRGRVGRREVHKEKARQVRRL